MAKRLAKRLAKSPAKPDGAMQAQPATPTASPARVAAFRTGLSAESRAAAYLMAKGYRILARRFRTPHGEIDLVAKRRNLVAFVEVKVRPTLAEAAEAVTPKGRQRIARAAQLWLARNAGADGFTLRFDAVLIAPRRWPRHLVGVFDADGIA